MSGNGKAPTTPGQSNGGAVSPKPPAASTAKPLPSSAVTPASTGSVASSPPKGAGGDVAASAAKKGEVCVAVAPTPASTLLLLVCVCLFVCVYVWSCDCNFSCFVYMAVFVSEDDWVSISQLTDTYTH